jgi:hypothetical protein
MSPVISLTSNATSATNSRGRHTGKRRRTLATDLEDPAPGSQYQWVAGFQPVSWLS